MPNLIHSPSLISEPCIEILRYYCRNTWSHLMHLGHFFELLPFFKIFSSFLKLCFVSSFLFYLVLVSGQAGDLYRACAWVSYFMLSLFRNKRFMLNLMLKRNASNFTIFLQYENLPKTWQILKHFSGTLS